VKFMAASANKFVVRLPDPKVTEAPVAEPEKGVVEKFFESPALAVRRLDKLELEKGVRSFAGLVLLPTRPL
jgi:hypothetical protein